jgi:16S rRNA (guanine(966)-N(2))-methyltransferase RsmD
VKEAWMSILQANIAGSRVLDLFAGSGSLGLEALSRGAASVDFVETDRISIDVLRANMSSLGVRTRCRIIPKDAVRFARKLGPAAYDIVFADPPFRTDHAKRLIDAFRQTPFTQILGVEHRASVHLSGDRTETYGDISITFCYPS